MILTAHQPGYLPWLGLFHKIALSDQCISLSSVQYQRSDWNHRNRVRINGQAAWLTVPVNKKGYLSKKYSDIEIDNSQHWQKKHWQTLLFNYKKSPYFKSYSDFFEDIYQRQWLRLVELNEYLLKWFLKELGIHTLVLSALDGNFTGTKDDLILNMCVNRGADVFIFGSQGRNYVDVRKFAAKNIMPYFQEYQHPVYHQEQGTFIPSLSVVDLLFNMGGSSLDVIMSNNINKKQLADIINFKEI